MSLCWLKVSIGATVCPELIVVELMDDRAPKATANFRKLCEGGDVLEGTTTRMGYKGSSFHRIVPSFVIQGGDYTNGDGTGGVSIYGAPFEDENTQWTEDRAGLVAMANSGPNTNGSQFFITLGSCKHLDGGYVWFGRVIRGMNTVRRLEQVPVGPLDVPQVPCLIVDCGVVDRAELPPLHTPNDGDLYSEYPQDTSPPLTDSELREAAEHLRTIGNTHFANENFDVATEKYRKALRYLGAVTPVSVLEDDLRQKSTICHSNVALCELRRGRWNDALDAAKKALALNPKHLKSRLRHGTALLQLKDYEAATADAQSILADDPQNAEAQALLHDAQEQAQQQRAKVAAGFRKMFS